MRAYDYKIGHWYRVNGEILQCTGHEQCKGNIRMVGCDDCSGRPVFSRINENAQFHGCGYTSPAVRKDRRLFNETEKYMNGFRDKFDWR